ncbi:SLAM family member 7 [Pteronotus mesoamericanus]|uniref:SLAM family member 7 n=1 Tax=Pteronotus mesoamericanus TaxID=1884717 RepID=UPI0023ECF7DA|nr:SLAM family member 7 [Pteronotus parnellii mesoamericanus]
MPVSPANFIFIFLLCQLTGSAASRTLKELVGALDGSVTFPLMHSVNLIDSIVWTFNTTTLVTIQPKTANNQDIVIVTQNHNKKRVDFPHGNYSLKLSKLNKNDSGAYRVQIYSSSLLHPFTQEYELRVYEYLSKPKIAMGLLQNNKNGTCVTNLTCSMEQREEDVTYSWKSLGQTANESFHGSILPISWRPGEKDMPFICMARNPISSNSSNPVFPRKLCEGVTGDLYPIIALNQLWMCLLLSVFILVTITFIMWRQKRKGRSIKEKKMDTHQEILNYYPPSGETSEYDTISNYNKTIPEEDSVNTVYSVVQLHQKMEKTHSLPVSPETPRQFIYKNVI